VRAHIGSTRNSMNGVPDFLCPCVRKRSVLWNRISLEVCVLTQRDVCGIIPRVAPPARHNCPHMGSSPDCNAHAERIQSAHSVRPKQRLRSLPLTSPAT